MICCREVAVLLLEYSNRELPEDRCREVDEHRCACPHCDNFVRSYITMITICQQLPSQPVPPHLMERLHAAVR